MDRDGCRSPRLGWAVDAGFHDGAVGARRLGSLQPGQSTFRWDDSHLHVFETPYGSFGTADTDLGYRAETSVTLEQVAPAVNSKLRYTYDFGDDWDHDIRVEKVLDHDETAGYPRCTGGRRAAPPDDCGGIWGYAELVEVLQDPADQEHDDRLEWLGLDDAAEFDPDRFDAARSDPGTVLCALTLSSRPVRTGPAAAPMITS